MAHTYNKTTWVNEQTPLNADNLNNMENGIKNNSQDISTLELAAEKLDKSLKDIKLDLTADRANNTNFQSQITKQLEDIDANLTATIECKHAIEITGNTGDEHGLAIEDQQMLLNKVQGQSFVVNQLVENKTYTNSDVTDIKQQLDFVIQSYTYNNEYVTLIPYRSYPLNSTSLKLEGIVTLPDNMNTLTLKHSGSDSDINFAYLRELKSHSNHKALYSLVLKTCNINVINGVNVDDIMVIDLTQMFGAGNEPATADEFHSRYNQGYIPYNEGTFVHSNCELVSTGRNIWDEEWALGTMGSSGNISGNSGVTTKNFIPVLPNSTYTSNLIWAWCEYDKNKNFLGRTSIKPGTPFTTQANCHYIKCSTGDAYYSKNGYQSDIIINVGDTPFPYEPHKKQVIKDIGTLTNHDYIINNVKYIKGGVSKLSELNWKYSTTKGYWYASSPLISNNGLAANLAADECYIQASHYPVNTYNDYKEGELAHYVGSLYFKSSDNLNPPTKGYVLYKTTHPTEEPITLPSGYAVYTNGIQIQDGEVPYILEKEYSLNTKAQVLVNIEIDREQQKQLNKLNNQVSDNTNKLENTVAKNTYRPSLVRTYMCLDDFFYEYNGDGNFIEEVDCMLDNISPQGIFEYFRKQIFKMGWSHSNGQPLEGYGPYTIIGMFIPYSKSGYWLPETLRDFFDGGPEYDNLDSFKVEILGGYESAAECTMVMTAYSKDAKTYTYQIACIKDVDEPTLSFYNSDGWRCANITLTELQQEVNNLKNNYTSIEQVLEGEY